jgi:hypothetical protein
MEDAHEDEFRTEYDSSVPGAAQYHLKYHEEISDDVDVSAVLFLCETASQKNEVVEVAGFVAI